MADEPKKPEGETSAPPPVPPFTPNKSRLAKAAKNHFWAREKYVLECVEAWARDMKSQASIAVYLGKPLKTFEAALAADKGENPLRLAFEAGRAAAEQAQIDACQQLQPGNPKQMVAWIFYMKAQFGWRDKPDVGGSDAPRITFVLPGALSEEEYYKKLGVEGPIDTRPMDKRGQLGGVKIGEMKDVTPTAEGKLPVLGASVPVAPPAAQKPLDPAVGSTV